MILAVICLVVSSSSSISLSAANAAESVPTSLNSKPTWYSTKCHSGLWRLCDDHSYLPREPHIQHDIMMASWYGRGIPITYNFIVHFRFDFWRSMYCIDGLVQDCSNCIANTLELLQSCTYPSIYIYFLINCCWSPSFRALFTLIYMQQERTDLGQWVFEDAHCLNEM